ncbi:MAG: flavodoxin family protein, partial [Rhodospirillaceae bacterium]
MKPPKILVVFYSRSGMTRRVAQVLAARLGCDLEEIAEAKGRRGIFGYLRSVREARRKQPAPVAASAFNPSSYDLVIIGTPVWVWSLSSPVRGYLTAHAKTLPE